ncbi:MAG TPA: methyltransferase domain-containing protein [Pseudomonas sp.]|uniref:class I SAM-dependent methyltransferase n=1 Tax=Pseudomonas sp. TaxID=306 RepID=UPI002CDDB3B6|nr:methyltransferase domain-containing protein [Pseudomonas sp.]HWH88320.1 methyltransferase domain-containing protein [Pseudomonas sp.]
MKLDIGCGPKCLPGFVGVDRFPLPGVQVVADLDKPLPFEDNSIELVHAAHSLEHVSDLMFTMRELYRVCKHKAQICIVVPYYEQKLNLANPYHLQVFNEHTPRFWSSCSWAPIDKKEYYHPHAVTWGLSQSDNSDPGLEIRLLRMEFFYFPRFNKMDPDCRREMRQHLTDVCHQVAYHLVVWKEGNEDDYVALTENLDSYPFLDTPALQKSRNDANLYDKEKCSTFSYAEEFLDQRFKEQYVHVAECERKLLRNEKLIRLLMAGPDLPDADLKRFNNHVATNYSRREPIGYRVGKDIPTDGYVEYPVSSAGECDSISVCVYLSGDAHNAHLGVELVDRSNKVVWNAIKVLSGIDTVGVVNFSIGETFKQENLAFIRFFAKDLYIKANVVECLVTPRWPLRSTKVIPYVCFSHDE